MAGSVKAGEERSSGPRAASAGKKGWQEFSLLRLGLFFTITADLIDTSCEAYLIYF